MVAANNFRNLSGIELQQTLLICEQLHHADSDKSFLQHCHRVLDSAFGHVHHSTELYRLNPLELTELENPTVDPKMIDLFTHHITDHPYVEQMFSEEHRHLETIQQETTLTRFKKTTLYNEFYTKVHGQNQLWLAYRDQNELLSCVYLRETEYSNRELVIAQMIHPHIETAWKNWKRTRKLKQELGVLKSAIFQTEEEETVAARMRGAFDLLTARQNDVIELVALGKDNQQIADELKISIFTVKKHLQTIFQTLDVAHRTQLAAKWHQAFSITIF